MGGRTMDRRVSEASHATATKEVPLVSTRYENRAAQQHDSKRYITTNFDWAVIEHGDVGGDSRILRVDEELMRQVGPDHRRIGMGPVVVVNPAEVVRAATPRADDSTSSCVHSNFDTVNRQRVVRGVRLRGSREESPGDSELEQYQDDQAGVDHMPGPDSHKDKYGESPARLT